MDDNLKISAFILAGGKSKRFKQDKSLYPYEGKPLIQHVYDMIEPVFSKVCIIADDGDKYNFLNADIHPDIIPGLGAIGGLYTALEIAEESRAFLLPCDMPSINTEFISYMLSIPDEYDLIIPELGGHYEPLHAIYKKTCLKPLKDLIDSGDKKIINFFKDVNMRTITEDEICHYDDPFLMFRNINYKEDI